MKRVGLVSDTHGLLRPEVLDFLRGSDHIIHAGDICEPDVLDALRQLAPLTAVRGNNDAGPRAEALREQETLQVEGVRIHVIHDLSELPGRAPPPGVHALVSGHSHKPKVEQREGTLWVNPGSAGPRRFKLPISAGELLVDGATVSARLVTF
ncbi:metallophosphoesterase family protein [Ramlibacter terrae]|uniref:Phosphoesterase n=1 Tax=Ramlibacter terrae TaxID=2732511 RepID=A0ABX6P4U8_9BURK|nr:metallophosphoesterase family protein [Ramlibacter terrae]